MKSDWIPFDIIAFNSLSKNKLYCVKSKSGETHIVFVKTVNGCNKLVTNVPEKEQRVIREDDITHYMLFGDCGDSTQNI